jgi:hypothetical protein
MLPSKQNRFFHLLIILFSIFNLLACAGYPSDPRAPQTADDTYEATEDEMLNIPVEKGVLANDKAKEGTKIFLDTKGVIKTQKGGEVNFNVDNNEKPDGSFTYTPPEDYNGDDRLVYKIHNQKGKTGEATILFKVAPVNDPPDPKDDQAETLFNEPVTINVLANDEDPDKEDPEGDTMTIQPFEPDDVSYGYAQVNNDQTITYTPDTISSGDVYFEYTVFDKNGATGIAQVHVIIVGGDITLEDYSITVEEGQSFTFPTSSLLPNDDNGVQLTVIDVGDPNNGTAVLEGDSITYTPTPDYSGADHFPYIVETDDGRTASATVNVRVTPVFDPPTISDITDQEILQGQSTGALIFRVSDPDTAPSDLSVLYRVINANPENLIPDNGVQVYYSGILPVGTIRVTPNPSLFGTATIRVVVRDPEGNRAFDDFTLTVNSNTPNQPPTISDIPDQQINLGSSTGPLSFTYNDPDPGTTPADLSVTYSVTNAIPANLIPANGIILTGGMDGNGTIQVTPAPELTGTATVTIVIQDPQGLRVSDSFVLTVLGNPNTPPSISPNAMERQELELNDTETYTFFVSDQESSFDTLSFSAQSSNPAVATVLAGGNGIIRTLTVTAVGFGMTTINAQVTDEGELSTPVNFLLSVSGTIILQNNSARSLSTNLNGAVSSGTAPLAENDIYSTGMGQTLTVGSNRGVLTNDRDFLDQTLRVTTVNTSRLTLNTNGSFTYRPPAGFSGRQSFTYTVSNGDQSATATLTFVVGGNQVPQVIADSYVADAGIPLNIPAARGLLANDIDPDGQQLSVVSTGVYGTLFGGEVNIWPNGSFSYIAPENFDGFDSFTYTVSDGRDSAVGVAEISVTP